MKYWIGNSTETENFELLDDLSNLIKYMGDLVGILGNYFFLIK